MESISTNQVLFLIKFRGQLGAHITSLRGVTSVIKENKDLMSSKGLESIKVSNERLPTFNSVSRDELYDYLSWETEVLELLGDFLGIDINSSNK